MSMTELKLSFASEKLEALRFFMEKKQQTLEKEMQDCLDKTYERVVPAQVREYVEMRAGQEQTQVQQPVQEAEQAAAPAERERPAARQSRRQREQVAPEAPSAPGTQNGTEGSALEEAQGMNLSM